MLQYSSPSFWGLKNLNFERRKTYRFCFLSNSSRCKRIMILQWLYMYHKAYQQSFIAGCTWPPNETWRLASASKATRLLSKSFDGITPLYSTKGLHRKKSWSEASPKLVNSQGVYFETYLSGKWWPFPGSNDPSPTNLIHASRRWPAVCNLSIQTFHEPYCFPLSLVNIDIWWINRLEPRIKWSPGTVNKDFNLISRLEATFDCTIIISIVIYLQWGIWCETSSQSPNVLQKKKLEHESVLKVWKTQPNPGSVIVYGDRWQTSSECLVATTPDFARTSVTWNLIAPSPVSMKPVSHGWPPPCGYNMVWSNTTATRSPSWSHHKHADKIKNAYYWYMSRSIHFLWNSPFW